SPVTICDAPVNGGAGTWSSQGVIVFDPGASGLMKVEASGGVAERIASQDAKKDAENLSWPYFLPDGRTLLVTTNPGPITTGSGIIAMLALDTGQWTSIGPGAQAQYVASGHIVFHAPHVREGELQAVQFDLQRQAARGDPVSVLADVFRSENNG